MSTQPDRPTLLGANLLPTGGAAFRVWAPRVSSVEVELYTADGPARFPLDRQAAGYHLGVVERAGVGDRYRYRLDGGQSLPDPASRSQPEGVHGPSAVVDPGAFVWNDADWPGLDRNRLVMNAELRWTPARFIDMAIFYDTGKVAARREDLDFKSLKESYGIGLRLIGLQGYAFRIEAARSRENNLRLIFSAGGAI